MNTPRWLPAVAAFLLTDLPTGAEMLPFTMPWDDVSANTTNLADTLHAPAGRWGRIAVSDDGHYELAGERLRFFGVNIGSGACFPRGEKAQPIARRLARFGFNVVRFHHMESNWARSTIDYSSGNSRTLDAASLDRLDRFVAELKAAGVYINLNLLTSRVFRPGDGLPAAIDQVEWKTQHVLAFWDDDLLALQKEYAAALLTHVNPHTGLSYAEDPAVAFVEINNENGLLHQWHSGALDSLPSEFSDPLAARWNDWLRTHYADTAELNLAWDAVDEPEGPNLIENGDFAVSTGGWVFEQHQGAVGSLAVGPHAGRQSVAITTLTPGTAGWHLQFHHPGLAVDAGQIHTLRFRARASAAMDLGVNLSQAHDPWQAVGLSRSVPLSTTWQEFQMAFFADATDDNVRVAFNGMGTFDGTVYLADVELRVGGRSGGPGAGTSLEAGNLTLPAKAEPLSPGHMRDWCAFLRELETEYWAEMHRYVSEDLGFGGIVWGTTIMNTMPSTQLGFDAADAHAYWQHPHFPGVAWSPTDWTVENGPMVNAADGGTLGRLALQAVAGLPMNITEYQHSAPNTYSTSAALYLALYGSLQDWDGLYLFHYGSGEDDWDRGAFNGFFDLDQHSPKLVNAALGSLMFREFMIAGAQETIVINFDRERELEVAATAGGAWNVAHLSHLGVSSRLPLRNAVRLSAGANAVGQEDPPPAPSGDVDNSDTGELSWDRSLPGSGLVTLDTPRAKSVIGFDAGRAMEFDDLTWDPGATEQGWSTFAAVLRSGRFDTLSHSGGQGLIATTGMVENTGMGWTDATRTSVGSQWGSAPVLTENIPGSLGFPTVPPDRVRVWALDVRGNRSGELPSAADGNGGTRVELGGAHGSLWYEFEVTAPAPPDGLIHLRTEKRRAHRVTANWGILTGTTDFRVEYALDDGPWSEAQGVGTFDTDWRGWSLTLPGLPENTGVRIRVTPTNTAGDGPASILETNTRQTYASWAQSTFTATQLLDPRISGPQANPDADSLTNELEAALGLDPHTPEPSPLPLPRLELQSSVLDEAAQATSRRLLRWELPGEALAVNGPALALRLGSDLESWDLLDGSSPFHGDTPFRVSTAVPEPDGPGTDGRGGPVFWQWTTIED